MNYLAHAYLSGNDIPLSVGNFIADSVKGKKYLSYPAKIIRGILLHRAIDHYTDNHLIFKKNVSKLFPKFRHYSRVIIDIYYDHFLALNWDKFHCETLSHYNNTFIKNMLSFKNYIPNKILSFLTKLKTENWFLHYTSMDGVENILYKMDSRTKFESNMYCSIKDLKDNYSSFEKDFFMFFKDIKYFSEKQIDFLNKEFLPNDT